MGRLSQVGWNVSIEQRLKAAEINLQDCIQLIAELEDRIKELGAKRGPGRPKVERDTAGSDRKV